MKKLFKALIGNLASSLWFIPPLSKFIHMARGVRFGNSRSSVFITRGVRLDTQYPELLNIQDDVWLTQNVIVLTHYQYSEYQMARFDLKEFVAPVTIETGVFVGVGSIILPGVTIGAGSYIGAGSIVKSDIPPNSVAVGNPCRVVRTFGHH